MSDYLMTTDEVAKALRISKQSLSKMAQDGRLPSIRVGKLLRFRQCDVKQYVETGGDVDYGNKLRQDT